MHVKGKENKKRKHDFGPEHRLKISASDSKGKKKSKLKKGHPAPAEI